MSAMTDLISQEIEKNPESEKFFVAEGERLDAAVALMALRESQGLTQRELAEKVGKPQSTIARIEKGTMTISFKVMSEIAHSLGKEIKIQFI